MIHAVANGIELALSNIETAMTVLEAAMEQAIRDEKLKAKSSTDRIWLQEIHNLHQLMKATHILMREPVAYLEDIKGTAWQLADEAREGEDGHVDN